MNGWRTLLPNAWYIAIREYRARATTRTFLVGTIVLAGIAFAVSQIPVIVGYVDSSAQTNIGVLDSGAALPSDAHQILDLRLNGTPTSGSTHKDYVLSYFGFGQEGAANQAIESGDVAILVTVKREASGDLGFVIRTDAATDGKGVFLLNNALQSVVIEDRLIKAGTSSQAITAPFAVSYERVNPGSGSGAPRSLSDEVSTTLQSTLLIVLMLMAIISYGTWVAMSVAEEKGSRVMELMLNAATPLQMLAGKVVGNGAAGLTQYGVTIGAALLGVQAQGRIASALDLPASSISFGGIDPGLAAAFIVLFILGFVFYSLLYAALGSLVSRQEDVQSATSPLMTLVLLGYFVAIFAVDSLDQLWVQVMSYVPFFSPYLMLVRVGRGAASMPEFLLAVAILIGSIAVALVLAARVYAAGVLLYGQRVGLRDIAKLVRSNR